MVRIYRGVGRRACTLAAAVAITLFATGAEAGSFKVLYSFIGEFNNAKDGAVPTSGLLADKAGNLYGTTSQGGNIKCQCGTIFELSPTNKETVLFTFAGKAGEFPVAGLIADSKGNLYGTTQSGGAHGGGVVFKLSPKGVETVLHAFCSRKNCADGSAPDGGLIADKSGNLYGTTSSGGALDLGVVFRIAKDGSETVLHAFKGNEDGATPMSGLLMDSAHNLFGTTSAGGSTSCEGPGCGTVYEIAASGKEKVLYAFCTVGSCVAGQEPWASLIEDKAGNLYGTTRVGGGHGVGTVFELSTSHKESVLYNFTGGKDGSEPIGGLIADANGNLYGTTIFGGGSAGSGVVFELEKSGKEKALHAFSGGNDGGQPKSTLIVDSQGRLYGTGQVGGTESAGVVFRVAE
jgi:uncharacterized repeat protein (TIGR03803 family)